MSDFELVVFDCDGVLVNSEAIYIKSELAQLERIGVVFERAEYIRMFMGIKPVEWEERIGLHVMRSTGRSLPEGFFRSLYESEKGELEASLTALPGAFDVVSRIGAKRCVASSSRMPILEWKLELTGLLELFHPHVFSGEMVERGKPDPDLFLHAAAEMDADPARSVVVEDSANGVLAARAAGMTVVGFTGGDHCLDGHGEMLAESGADSVIGSLSELEATLSALSR
jgi:HAD superfamily hydrolase (TIGR01509 family)